MKVRFEAGIHGIDLEKEIGKPKSTARAKASEVKRDRFLFQDPKDYEKLSPEERQKRTDTMMSFYRGKMSKAIGGA
jgi:hypothetical protein